MFSNAASRFLHILLLIAVLVGPTRAVGEWSCSCPDPPGGSCQCERGQWATCLIQDNKCVGSCETITSKGQREVVAVEFLSKTLGVEPRTLGFSADGHSVDSFRARLTADMLRRLLTVGRRGPHEFEAKIPEVFKAEMRHPASTVRVGLDPNLEEDLRAAFGGVASGKS